MVDEFASLLHSALLVPDNSQCQADQRLPPLFTILAETGRFIEEPCTVYQSPSYEEQEASTLHD